MTLETKIWLGVGFVGQAVFTARFLVQWFASERKRESVVPVPFWWLSLVGGMMLLVYAVHREDPVIIVGQSLGVIVYVRNLMLVQNKSKTVAHKKRRPKTAAVPKPHYEGRVEGAAEGRSIVG